MQGIKAIEVAFNTPGAAKMIEKLVEKYSDQVLVGAGTVLDAETARIAILSGASFILSPSLNLEMIKYAKVQCTTCSGISTPTEAVTAWENGAQIVKVFPAGVFGPNYIKQLKDLYRK